MHSLRNSPPDCFSQTLTHLEPRVSCTACNSLGSKPPPYGFLWRYGNRNAVGADSIRPRLNAFLTQQLPLHTQGEPIGLFYFLKRGEHAVCVKGYIVVWIVLKVRHCKFAQVLVAGEGTVGGDL